MNRNTVLTTPMVITDIPGWDSGLTPREFRIQISAPDTPSFVNLRLHIMSDTYLRTDQKVDMHMEICRTDFGPTPKEKQTGPDKKVYMEKLLSLMRPDNDQVALGKFVEKVKIKNISRKKAAIKKALEAEHGNSDSDSDHDEDPESSSPDKAKSTKKKGYFSAWNKMAVVTRIGCCGLEKHIPDSLGTDEWVDWKYCNPKRTRNYVSEWTLPWDYKDDNNGEWEDVGVSRKNMKRFNKRRISLGREIGAERNSLDWIDDNAMTGSAGSSVGGSEKDSSAFLSLVTPPNSENANSSWEGSEPNGSLMGDQADRAELGI